MRGWIRMTLLGAAVAVAFAACARAEGITAPDGAAWDGAPVPPESTPQSDSTGRWGGHLGSGG